MTATHKPDTTKREELESSDSEAQHFSHLSLTTALMWTTLLQCVLDFGERARVNPKIRSRVPTLVPAKVIDALQRCAMILLGYGLAFLKLIYVFVDVAFGASESGKEHHTPQPTWSAGGRKCIQSSVE